RGAPAARTDRAVAPDAGARGRRRRGELPAVRSPASPTQARARRRVRRLCGRRSCVLPWLRYPAQHALRRRSFRAGVCVALSSAKKGARRASRGGCAMRTRSIRGTLLPLGFLLLLVLCRAALAGAQLSPAPYGEDRPPWLALVARTDPADPTRYVGVAGDDLSKALTVVRDGVREPVTIPYLLQRGDEIETEPNVVTVIRYPIGDVYVDGSTRVRIGSLDVLFGKVFARVRGLFSVENQNVVAGVEGTEFEFEVAKNGATQITVLDGTVLSSSKN